jgi:hypothetical protein
MNRRSFLQRLASLTAIAIATGATTITIDGCSFNIKDAINAVLNSALAVLKVAEPGASWTSSLQAAVTALQQAEASWQSGGAGAIVIDALNTIEAIIAVIPATAVYSPLVDILVAGIEAVVAAFGVKSLTPKASRTRATVVNSTHYRAVTLHQPGALHPTWQGAYKAQWNAKARALNLPQAIIA